MFNIQISKIYNLFICTYMFFPRRSKIKFLKMHFVSRFTLNWQIKLFLFYFLRSTQNLIPSPLFKFFVRFFSFSRLDSPLTVPWGCLRQSCRIHYQKPRNSLAILNFTFYLSLLVPRSPPVSSSPLKSVIDVTPSLIFY